RETESKLKEMDRQMEEASAQQDYAEAMFIKSQKLALQEEYDRERADWFANHNIDESVGEEDVADVVSKWTGIPVKRMVQEEMTRLLDMEAELHKRVVGQHEAIEAVSDAIRRSRSGLRDPRRPMGSFIFVGPTGVGKTELAKALAEYLFDSEDAIVRVDMSEYGERHTVARMIAFRPEFINRIDDIIIFRHLTLEELTQVVDIQVAELAGRLATSGVGLRLSQATKEHLSEVGYDRTFGARPLRRAIQRELETPLSKRLLKGDITSGHTVVVEYSPD